MEASIGPQLLSAFARQVNNSTGGADNTITFEAWIATYWYIILIVLAVLVVVCVLLCACILRRHPREAQLDTGSNNKNKETSIDLDQVQGTSHPAHRSSLPTTTSCSLSADSTPIPSPHSSQHSIRTGSGLSRGRRTSPRLSSGSSETLRPDVRSISSVGSSSSLMTHQSKVQDGMQQGGMERRSSSRRSKSSPIVRVSSMPSVKSNRSGLHAAHSTMSVESSSSGRSGVAYCFYPSSDLETLVEVGVTVHTPGDPEKSVRIATAAALAESARKLAQEAASFIDEDQVHPPFSYTQSPHYRGGSLRGTNRNPLLSASGRSSSFSLNHHYNHTPYHQGYSHRPGVGFGGHRSVSALGRHDMLPMPASRRTGLVAQFTDPEYPPYLSYSSAHGDSRYSRDPVSQLQRQYSLGSRLRDHHMSRMRDVSPPGGRTNRMLSASGDSSKSNLHFYTNNYRGNLSSASARPTVVEKDGLPLKNDRFPFSKREELNEYSSSAAPSHPSVKEIPKANSVIEVEQMDGVSLDAVSPIPPSPSTSTGLSSQTEASSQVEEVTRNPTQVNPTLSKEPPDVTLQTASSGHGRNHTEPVSPSLRRLVKCGSPVPEPIHPSTRHHSRTTQAQGRREVHASANREDSPTYRRGSFDSRTGQQGYIGSPVQHHISGIAKKLYSFSSRDHSMLMDREPDTNYYNGRETVNDASRQYLPGTISSVNVTVDV